MKVMAKRHKYNLTKDFTSTEVVLSTPLVKAWICDNCGASEDHVTRWVEKNPVMVALTTCLNICDQCAERVLNGQS